MNTAVYVPRPFHENELRDSLSGSLHTVVCGESGSGKSWLCRKILDEKSFSPFFVNSGNVSRKKSVTEAIWEAVKKRQQLVQTGQEDAMTAEANVLVAKGGANTKKIYKKEDEDLLWQSFNRVKKIAGKKTPVLVFDNLENIVENDALMEELGDIILLLDDEEFSGVKICLVGVPNNILGFFRRLERYASICNRLEELRPVTALDIKQVKIFIKLSFIDQLGLSTDLVDINNWASSIFHTTLGIAQKLQEYCLRLARLIEQNNWRYYEGVWDQADNDFLSGCLVQSYQMVDRCMNKRATKEARRNQVLFAISKINDTEFEVGYVEQKVRELFPDSTKAISLGIGQILSELTSEGMGIVTRIEGSKSYRMADPAYLMALRLLLYVPKNSDRVEKRILKR